MELLNHTKLITSYRKPNNHSLLTKRSKFRLVKKTVFNLHDQEPHLEFHTPELIDSGILIQTRSIDFDEIVEIVIKNGEMRLHRYGRPLEAYFKDKKWAEKKVPEDLEVTFCNEQIIQYRREGDTPQQIRQTRDKLIQRIFELQVLCDDKGVRLTDKEKIQSNLKDWNYTVMRHAMYHRKPHMEFFDFQFVRRPQTVIPELNWWVNFSWERQIWTYDNVFKPAIENYRTAGKEPTDQIKEYFTYLERVRGRIQASDIYDLQDFTRLFEEIPRVASLDCFNLYKHYDHEKHEWLPEDSLEVLLAAEFGRDRFDDYRFGFKLRINMKQQRVLTLEGKSTLVFPTYNKVSRFIQTPTQNLVIYTPQITDRSFVYLTSWENKAEYPAHSLETLMQSHMMAFEGQSLLKAVSDSYNFYLLTWKQVIKVGDNTTKKFLVHRIAKSDIYGKNGQPQVQKIFAVQRVEGSRQKVDIQFGVQRKRICFSVSSHEETENGDIENSVVIGYPEGKSHDLIDLKDKLRESHFAKEAVKKHSRILACSAHLQGQLVLYVNDYDASNKKSDTRVVYYRLSDQNFRSFPLKFTEEIAKLKIQFISTKRCVILVENNFKEAKFRLSILSKTGVKQCTPDFLQLHQNLTEYADCIWLPFSKRLVVLTEMKQNFMDTQLYTFRLKQ